MNKILTVAIVLFFSSCSKPSLLGNQSFGSQSFSFDYAWGGGFTFGEDSSVYIKADIYAGNGIILPLRYFGSNARLLRTVSLTNPDSSLVVFSAGDSTTGLQFTLANIARPGTYSFGNAKADNISIRAKCIFNATEYLNDSTLMSGSITIDTLTGSRIHAILSVPCVHNGYTVTIKNASFSAGF